MAKSDEFYIGYEPKAPKGIARRTRWTVIGLWVLALLTAATLVGSQQAFDFGVFEFGQEREFRGVLVERPYPMLLVERSAPAEGAPEVSAMDLVAVGKHGAAAAVAGMDGQGVAVRGSLVYNRKRAMIEVTDDGISAWDANPALLRALDEQPVSLGRHALIGEIVDSKCNLGVMKPGRSKPHKACAILCIRGGIPPVLRVTGEGGELTYYLLVDEVGEPVNDRVLEMVAEPVRIEGEVHRSADRLTLYADPAGYRRVD